MVILTVHWVSLSFGIILGYLLYNVITSYKNNLKSNDGFPFQTITDFKTLLIPNNNDCKSCNGYGVKLKDKLEPNPDDLPKICPECKGTGIVI